MADDYPTWTGDCIRCGTKATTFDVKAWSFIGVFDSYPHWECACCCRKCSRTSLVVLEPKSQNERDPGAHKGHPLDYSYDLAEQVLLVGLARECPTFVPAELSSVFDEGARCLGLGCHEAAGTMFRKVIDRATRGLLPDQPADGDKSHPDYLAWKVRRDLRLRLDWLLAKQLVPRALEPILDSVREDGNDAAHDVIGLEEAQDLEDFTVVFLEAMFTVPGQIEANRLRREARRKPDLET